VDKQGTSASSKFLDACRKYNSGDLTQPQLTEHTVRDGFNNVIDAFHIVGRDAVPRRFFIDERKGNNGIRITDEFSELVAGCQAGNLPREADARWRLVEAAWNLGVSRNIVTVGFDSDSENLFTVDLQNRRKSLTGVHAALNGYQKGFCFYCFSDLQLSGTDRPDVDHFFPHVLKPNLGPRIDGVWNLVLACRQCNRGIRGKSDLIPTLRLLERLSRRNEFLIASHHPLRETLMLQTGLTDQERRSFLNNFYNRAGAKRIAEWQPVEFREPVF
jgi:hypothetical protein